MNRSVVYRVLRPSVGLGLGLLLSSGCVLTPHERPGEPPRTAIIVRDARPESAANGELPSEIGASHLLVQYVSAQSAPGSVTRSKAEAKQRAEDALARARKGEDFAKLVSEYSDEPGAAERAGALGKFPRHAMVKPFAEAAFRLKVGEISEVVESQFGFHVILRTE